MQVHEWPDGAGILRRFLQKDEGGSDAARNLRQIAEEALVPWQDFKRLYDNPRFFTEEEAASLRLDLVFRDFFTRPFFDPNSPRELILRDRSAQVAPALVREQRHWQSMRDSLKGAKNLLPEVRVWIERTTAAFAEALRARGMPDEARASARAAELWKALGNPEAPIAILLHGVAAEGRGAEVVYQLGLCEHEQAAQLQARKELAVRGKVERPEDGFKAEAAWKDAEEYWTQFAADFPSRLGINAASLRLAETQAMRGATADAIRTLQNLPAAITDLEKLERLWRARQLEKQKQN
jgi:hypothetical protein